MPQQDRAERSRSEPEVYHRHEEQDKAEGVESHGFEQAERDRAGTFLNVTFFAVD